MTPRFLHVLAAVLVGSACFATGAAHADVLQTQPSPVISYKFDFESVALPLATSGTMPGYGLGKIGLSDSIGLAMSTELKAATGSSTVGVTVTGAVATQSYNGENHVKGATLGTSDAGITHLKLTDTFLVNNNFGAAIQNATTAKSGGATSDRFKLTFDNFLITGIQFDYEIFPDAQCPRYSNCGPDMTVLAGLNQIWHLQTLPSNQMDPQALGTTAAMTFAGVNSLTFIDWPSEIGIDNLVITGCANPVNGSCTPSKVPEPGSALLIGAGLLGLVARRKSRKVTA